MTKEALDALISRLEIRAVIFGVIVGIGVVGESVYGFRIWWNNRKLRKLQDEENLALQLKISEFQQKAEEAKRDSAAAESHLAGAKASSALAEQHAAEANERAKRFESQIAEANARAAEAELELAKFKAPRALSDDQARLIAGKLKPFGPQVFDVTAYWEKKESLDIAQRIADILTGLVGWTLEQPKSRNMIVGEIAGVIVSFSPQAGDKAKEAANALARALTDQGIEAKARADVTLGNMAKVNKIELTVGAKQ